MPFIRKKTQGASTCGMLFPTYEDAYYFLEEQHERLIGQWMYSEYDSFRAVYKR